VASAPTQFKLQKLFTRVGPIALVTMDNGADWQKPNTFGEAALRSLEGVLDQLRSRDWRGLLLTGKPPHDPAAWKRYRGGATGRLWLHGERLLPELEGHLDSVMFVGHDTRIAFLSDHEGVGNLYSCRPDGTDLRRHTDHDDFYARNASTDDHRRVLAVLAYLRA